MELLDDDEGMLEAAADAFEFNLGVFPNEDLWLHSLPFDSATPLAPHRRARDTSPLLDLPASLWARCFGFLDYYALVALRGVRVTLFEQALDLAWPAMLSNTWRRLDSPLEAFSCGRIKTSGLIGSLDQMMRGVPAQLLWSAPQPRGGGDGAEPATKLRRVSAAGTGSAQEDRDRELRVASLVAAMLGSLATLLQLAAPELEALKHTSDMAGAAARVVRLQDVLEQAKKALQRYRSKVVIPPSHLRVLRANEEAIDRHLIQLEVFRRGWAFATDAAAAPAPVALVLHRQMFGGLFRPGQPSHFTCQFVAAPSVASQVAKVSTCQVTAVDALDASERMTDCFTSRPATVGAQGFIDMPDWKFSKPTRQRLVQLEFAVDVTLHSGASHHVVSALTYPLLVYAHQKQWSSSFWNHLMHAAFAGSPKRKGKGKASPTCSWPTFVNAFQELMCMDLLSDPSTSKPVAALSSTDWVFIHAKFFGNRASVAQDDLSEFCAFISPFLFSLEFHRDFATMWEAGYVAGFLPRESVNLESYGPGAFLLRYSTNMAGELVISFVPQKGKGTKHYLVRDSDVSPKTRQALAQFLWGQPALVRMLRCTQVNAEYSVASLVAAPKEEVLREWLGGDVPAPLPEGYAMAL